MPFIYETFAQRKISAEANAMTEYVIKLRGIVPNYGSQFLLQSVGTVLKVGTGMLVFTGRKGINTELLEIDVVPEPLGDKTKYIVVTLDGTQQPTTASASITVSDTSEGSITSKTEDLMADVQGIVKFDLGTFTNTTSGIDSNSLTITCPIMNRRSLDELNDKFGDYLPLSGGTLTGNLNGTNASFSGNLTAQQELNGNSLNINGTQRIASNGDFSGRLGRFTNEVRTDALVVSDRTNTGAGSPTFVSHFQAYGPIESDLRWYRLLALYNNNNSGKILYALELDRSINPSRISQIAYTSSTGTAYIGMRLYQGGQAAFDFGRGQAFAYTSTLMAMQVASLETEIATLEEMQTEQELANARISALEARFDALESGEEMPTAVQTSATTQRMGLTNSTVMLATKYNELYELKKNLKEQEYLDKITLINTNIEILERDLSAGVDAKGAKIQTKEIVLKTELLKKLKNELSELKAENGTTA